MANERESNFWTIAHTANLIAIIVPTVSCIWFLMMWRDTVKDLRATQAALADANKLAAGQIEAANNTIKELQEAAKKTDMALLNTQGLLRDEIGSRKAAQERVEFLEQDLERERVASARKLDTDLILANLEKNGLSKNAARRIGKIYYQLRVLYDAAGLPERQKLWLEEHLKSGKLHNRVTGFMLLGIRKSGDVVTYDVKLEVSVDWDSAIMNADFHAEPRLPGISVPGLLGDQKIYDLAYRFSAIVRERGLERAVHMKLIDLNDIEDLPGLPFDKIDTSNRASFINSQDEWLELQAAEEIPPSGNIISGYEFESVHTPELKVSLKEVQIDPKPIVD